MRQSRVISNESSNIPTFMWDKENAINPDFKQMNGKVTYPNPLSGRHSRMANALLSWSVL